MQNKRSYIYNIYIEHFKEIYKRCDARMMEDLRNQIKGRTKQIALNFFSVIYTTIDGKKLIPQEVVETDLVPEIDNWIHDLFIIRHESEIVSYIDKQLDMGQKYARINMPPHLINLGSRALKMDICNHIINDDHSGKESRNIYTLINMLVDTTMAIVYETYFDDKLLVERRAQALHSHISGQELAEKCQVIRANMHDWYTSILNLLLENHDVSFNELPSIRHSDFALWVRHKASIFFPDFEEVNVLNKQVDEIEEVLKRITESRNSNLQEDFSKAVKDLKHKINETSWVLTSLAEQARTMDTGRDSLTRLFNRRYLDVIMQKETQYALHNQQPFVIFLIDIDHFKKINDTHGHQAGDDVLEHVAKTLQESVRAGDYVFRYGGEEFLILLADMDLATAQTVANKLINKVANSHFSTSEEDMLKVTISIGMTQYNGGLDYLKLIGKADAALYDAKNNGRNQYSVAA